jgi:protein-S-isoprenylcysteine O-methyltransferase Ste14
MAGVLRFTGWWFCIVYASIPLFWLVIHPFTSYWRARRRSPYRILLPFWAAIWALLALITYRWRGILLYQNAWSWLPGLGLILPGFWLYFASTRGFTGKYISGMAEILPGDAAPQLIVSGIRRRIRHPMYAGHFCEALGWSIGTGSVVCFALAAFAIFMGSIMIRAEDKELESRFGEQYRTYRRDVPAFLPKL